MPRLFARGAPVELPSQALERCAEVEMNWLRRLWNGSDFPRDKHGRVIEPRNARDGGRGELPPPPAAPPREWTLAERQRMMMVETENGPISPEAWRQVRNAQQKRTDPAKAMMEANASRNMLPAFDNSRQEAIASSGERMTRLRFESMSEHERLAWWYSRRMAVINPDQYAQCGAMRWVWHGPEGDEEL